MSASEVGRAVQIVILANMFVTRRTQYAQGMKVSLLSAFVFVFGCSRTNDLQSDAKELLAAMEQCEGQKILQYMTESEINAGSWNVQSLAKFAILTGPSRSNGWQKQGEPSWEKFEAQAGGALTQFYIHNSGKRKAMTIFLQSDGSKNVAPGLSAMMLNGYWAEVNLAQETLPIGIEKQKLWLQNLPDLQRKCQEAGIEGYVEATAPDFSPKFISWSTLESRLKQNIERLERKANEQAGAN